jgi:hypothetical protein
MVAEAKACVIRQSNDEIAAVRFLPLVEDFDDFSHLALPLHLQGSLGITGAGVGLDVDGAFLGGHARTTSTPSPGLKAPGVRTRATMPRLP